jgi:hypothetical protein
MANHELAGDLSFLADRFRELVVLWDQASGSPQRANIIFDETHELAKKLRRTPEGREHLLGFLKSENRAVRMSAAAECLEFDSQEAEAVLEEMSLDRGAHSFTASITLREYRAGKLNMDW